MCPLGDCPLHQQKKFKNNFLVCYGSLHLYIASCINLSDIASIQSLLPRCLMKEVNFKDSQNIRIQLQLDFSSLKENISAVISIDCNTVDKWVSVMTKAKCEGIKAEEMNKVLGFVLSIPASNTYTKHVFSLMNKKWSHDRNHCNVHLMRAKLQISVNFDYTCKEFVEFVKKNPKLQAAAKDVHEYSFK
ncbi:hypothetical protein PR048_013232 [Dryococelus australis]|uniref:Uncharacterized protein n=1 Tax=Dryococelus australis TaxID=614101 RepID=A0ABQ9HT40_9NEOP|nr:hypothetical protein PR048_013232 [Dryococelus australis]